MAIGRISGQLLYSNLERQGQDLSFDGNLLHLDVNNRRVAVNNIDPQYELDVYGTTRSNAFIGASITLSGTVSANSVVVSGNAQLSNTTVKSLVSNTTVNGQTGTFTTVVVAGTLNAGAINSNSAAIVNSLTANNDVDFGGNIHATSLVKNSEIFLGYGATLSGNTKTVLLGTAGTENSFTNVHIGSNVSGALGNVTINHYTSLANAVYIKGTLTTASTASIAGGLQGTVIGNITPTTGNFTNLTATVTSVTGNVGSTTYTDGALVVTGGAGVSENLNVGGDLSVGGSLFVSGGNLTNVNIGNITFANTTITTTITDGNITLTPTGTGILLVAADTSINGQLVADAITSNTSLMAANLTVTGNSTVTGLLTVQNFEANSNISAVGNISGDSGTFHSLLSVASNTTITSSQINMGADTPSFSYTTGAVVVAGGVGIAGNLNVNSTITADKLVSSGSILTNANIGNLTFSDTTLSTTLNDGNIELVPTGTGLIIMDTANAVKLPTGNSTQQPTNPPLGAFRYNTEIESPEFWNGDFWIATSANIDSEVINPDGVNKTFTLSRTATSTGVMVSMNGVLQIPGIAYVVSGNQITFTEIPQITDIADIRYISTGSVVPIHEEQAFSVKNVNFNAATNTRYAVDTTNTPITVTLPGVPSVGDAVYFADAGHNYSSNNLIIDPNGLTINGSASLLLIEVNGESFGLLWSGATWRRY